MNIIHLEPESVRSVANILRQKATYIYEQGQAMQNRVQAMDWESPNRDQFVASFKQFSQNMNSLAEMGILLANRVSREVDEWQGIDNRNAFAGLGKEIKDIVILPETGTEDDTPIPDWVKEDPYYDIARKYMGRMVGESEEHYLWRWQLELFTAKLSDELEKVPPYMRLFYEGMNQVLLQLWLQSNPPPN